MATLPGQSGSQAGSIAAFGSGGARACAAGHTSGLLLGDTLMKTAGMALEEEFASDHRELTRGFARLLELLESGEDAEASRLANHLDQVAGPHIEFEETVLYPAVERAEGSDFAARLYGEHRTAFEAIDLLLTHSEDKPIDAETRQRLIEQVQNGLDHAVSCGSLMGHLTALDETQHELFLQKLYDCRKAGRRWSKRDTSHESDGN